MARDSSTLGFALLGLLHQAPQSGYDLRKVFALTALGNYSSSPGAIYPALARLDRAGLVESRADRAQPLRPRMVYRPTRAGTAAMRRWLSGEVAREDVERHMDDLVLRFAFHWILDDRVATRRFLTALVGQVNEYVAELRRQRRFHPRGTPVHPRLALEAGIGRYLASARWARRALEQFTGGST